jgi:Fe-S cluster assembly protein SufD
MQTIISASQIQKAQDQHFSVIDKTHPCYMAKQKAWQHFKQLGLPSPKNEAYKYTPIAAKLANTFDLSQPTTTSKLTQATIAPYLLLDLDAYQLILINGKLSKAHANLSQHKPLFQVLTFTEAYQQQHPSFIQYGNQYDLAKYDALAALNTTLFEEGILIHIVDQAILDKPLLIYHITDSTDMPMPGLSYPRILITAGQNSQASLISTWHSIGNHPSFTNAVTEIRLAADAQLGYYNLQTQDLNQAYGVHATHCYQETRSILNHYSFTWDGFLMRNNLHFTIQAAHSETNMYGLYVLDQQQHVDNHTTVDHQQPHTQSNELYKGIIGGEATGVFNGKIYVQPDAQKTNAFQANNNLLISDQATIYTKPQLEIWADDVKCSHGATIGQLDEAQLFYLQARGIPINQARYMLLNAFASEVIEKVSLASLKQHLYSTLNQKLESFDIADI